ncbi:unnamed protein product [Meloidogyne enterolobii]|uniref:Uncharacterized protein n=1 Tax=Meloidogyne enterolobii TaxID=390850 RepID=A0ACB1B2I0_MELEN
MFLLLYFVGTANELMAFRFGQQAHGKGWCYYRSKGMILIENRHFYFSGHNLR